MINRKALFFLLVFWVTSSLIGGLPIPSVLALSTQDDIQQATAP